MAMPVNHRKKIVNLGVARMLNNSKKAHEHENVCAKSIVDYVDIYNPYMMLL